MSQHHQLSTQKFVDEVQKGEVREIRKHMAKRSFKSFLLLGFSITVFLFTMYAVFHMPTWFPEINFWLEQTGILTSAAS